MKLKQASNIVSKKIKGVYVLIEPNKHYLRELNPLATRLWQLTQKPITIDQLVSTITAEYKVDKKTAAKDINAWVKDFLKHNLLQKLG